MSECFPSFLTRGKVVPPIFFKTLFFTEEILAMEEQQTKLDSIDTPEARFREEYFSLFHEMQFRCTKNAMMNYHQAETYEAKGDIWSRVTSVCTAASASSVFASLLQKGQVLASRLGLAGLVGLPICGIFQFLGSSTSEFIPSYYERARKHTSAAAGWMQIAETARAMQLQMKLNPEYDLKEIARKYEELTEKKELVSKEVLIPRNTHKQFAESSETVFLALARRRSIYQEFLDLEAKQTTPATNIRSAEDIYF